MTSRSRSEGKEQVQGQQGPRPHEVTYRRAEKKEVDNQEQQKKENE